MESSAPPSQPSPPLSVVVGEPQQGDFSSSSPSSPVQKEPALLTPEEVTSLLIEKNVACAEVERLCWFLEEQQAKTDAVLLELVSMKSSTCPYPFACPNPPHLLTNLDQDERTSPANDVPSYLSDFGGSAIG